MIPGCGRPDHGGPNSWTRGAGDMPLRSAQMVEQQQQQQQQQQREQKQTIILSNIQYNPIVCPQVADSTRKETTSRGGLNRP